MHRNQGKRKIGMKRKRVPCAIYPMFAMRIVQRYWRKYSGLNQPTRSYDCHNLLALLTSILHACCASVLRNSLPILSASMRAWKMRRLLVRYVAQLRRSVPARFNSASCRRSRSGSSASDSACPFHSALRILVLPLGSVSSGGE